MSIAAKICGICSEEAVTAAVSEGAAYLGFVFYSPSPRAVTPRRAAQLCAAIPAGIERVGLFVDADDLLLETALAAAPLDILQFHGDETPERVVEVRHRFGRRMMKVVAISGTEDVLDAARYEDIADLLLFDAKPPSRPWMLSGGLTAEVLPDAVRISGARMVDVSSGVESRPGVKDPEKIRAFLTAARAL